jgi:hypothetical protein
MRLLGVAGRGGWSRQTNCPLDNPEERAMLISIIKRRKP